MPKKKSSSLARSLGSGLAHVQDTIDDLVVWGLKTARKVGEAEMPKRKKAENKYVYGAKKAGKGTLSFIGNIGDAFYEKYGELKKK